MCINKFPDKKVNQYWKNIYIYEKHAFLKLILMKFLFVECSLNYIQKHSPRRL